MRANKRGVQYTYKTLNTRARKGTKPEMRSKLVLPMLRYVASMRTEDTMKSWAKRKDENTWRPANKYRAATS